MSNQKVTNNFWFSEFRPHGADMSWMPEFDLRKDMIINLANNLQIIRNIMTDPAQSMNITRGVSTLDDIDRLKALGDNPSLTSDHFCGLAVPIDKLNKKYFKVGSTYNFAVGAADCVPVGMPVIDFFMRAVYMTKRNECRFGQVIHEYNPTTGAEWIHFGNDPSLYYTLHTMAFNIRDQFMESLDGGKTYKILIPN